MQMADSESALQRSSPRARHVATARRPLFRGIAIASRADLRILAKRPARQIPDEVHDVHLLADGGVAAAGTPLLQPRAQRPPELWEQVLRRHARRRSALP